MNDTTSPSSERAPPRPLLGRALAALARPRAGLVILLVVAALVGGASLGNGLALDDLLLLGDGASDPSTLFEIGARTPAEVDAWRQGGIYPWWTSDALQVRFLRPLAALSHALDGALWPNSPALMHLHSLLWYLLLVVAAGALYREVSAGEGGPRRAAEVAGLALLVYAIDDAHAPNVGWLAARNSLIGATFATLALLAHVRARARGWRIGQVLAPLALALALLAAEASIAVLGYFVAHALVVERGASWRARAASLLPVAVVVIAWFALYVGLGYGARGCGLYTDPLADPLGFVGAAIERGGLLVGAALGLPMVVDLVGFIPGASVGAAALFLLLTALVGRLLWPLLRSSAAARFWALGALLAAAAHGTTVPQERYLLLITLGSAGLVAGAIAALIRGELRSRLARALAWSWIVLHVALPPLLAVPRATGTSVVQASLERSAAAIPAAAAADEAPTILVNAPGDVFALYAPVIRARAGLAPAGVEVLYAGTGGVTVERPADDRLLLRAAWLAAPGDRVFNDLAEPFRVGDRIAVDGLVIEIAEVDEGGAPRALLLHLDADRPGRPPRRWMIWDRGAPTPWRLPAVGERVLLQPASWDFATPASAS